MSDERAPKSGLIPDFWHALFGSVEPNDFRLRLGGDPEITPPVDDPYARSYDEIISIQQKGSKGFRTFDINPFDITQVDYPCQLTSGVLGNLFGFEDGATSYGYGCDTNMSPYWRTVSIEANATWLRFEFLPVRTNDFARGSNAFTGPAMETQTNGPVVPDIGTGNTTLASNWFGKAAMTNAVILQFDDPNGSPVIVKHGDSFKIPFNTVYITFKQWTPRFRILVGYNTESVTVDDRMLATRPAFASGRGVLNNPTMQYQPFCITADDVTGVEGGGLTYATGSGVISTNLVRNLGGLNGLGVSVRDLGQGLMFIHGFTASVRHLILANVGAADFKIWLVRVSSSGNNIAKLCQVTIPLSSTATSGHGSIDLSEPIRVNLNYGERLALKVFSGVAFDLYYDFSVRGYVYGLIEGVTNPVGTNPLTPFHFTEYLAENPYPMDNLMLGLWPGGAD